MKNINKINNKIEIIGNKPLVLDRTSPNDGLRFDGVNDYVTFGNIINYNVNDVFSFVFIYKPRTLERNSGTTQRIFTKRLNGQNGIQTYTDENGNIVHRYMTNDTNYIQIIGSACLTVDVLSHICITKKAGLDTSSFKIYHNGVLKSSLSTITGTIPSNIITTSSMEIGRLNGNNFSHLKGIMYDFKIFNKELTQIEITSLYNTANKGIPSASASNLVTDWKFDNRQGTILTDYSGNGYNGTLTNFLTTSDLGRGAWVDINGNNITQL